MIPRHYQPSLFDDRRTRVINVKLEPGLSRDPRFVYVGRVPGRDPRAVPPGLGGWAGNPWPIWDYPDALARFEIYAEARLSEPAWRVACDALEGKILGCSCVRLDGGGDCHAKWFVRRLER